MKKYDEIKLHQFEEIKKELLLRAPKDILLQSGVNYRSIMRYREGKRVPRSKNFEKLLIWMENLKKENSHET